MKQQEPIEEQSTTAAILIACVVIAAATIVLVSMAGNAKTLEEWLYRYQTLITGLFAVGAAYLTVRQMQRTDAESERRHRELARLQVRSERLIVERMIFPQFGVLRSQFKALEKLNLSPFTPIDSEEVQNEAFFAFADNAATLSRASTTIREILERDVWKDAERLFSGFLRWELEQLEKEAVTLTMCSNLVGRFSSEQTKKRYAGDAWKTAEIGHSGRYKEIIAADSALRTVLRRMEQVFQLIYELADTYEIGHHPRPSLDQS